MSEMQTQNDKTMATEEKKKTFFFEDLEKDFPDIRITRSTDIRGDEYVSDIKLPKGTKSKKSPYTYRGRGLTGSKNEVIITFSFSIGNKLYTYTAKPKPKTKTSM